MSRPILLVFLLLILIITSQFEWKQQFVEVDPSPSSIHKQQQISNREEAVKEKIILLQEKNIQRLNELVRSLQEQVLQCRAIKEAANDTARPSTENVMELEQKQILGD